MGLYSQEQKEVHLKFLPGKNLMCFEKKRLKRLSKKSKRIFPRFKGQLGQTYLLFNGDHLRFSEKFQKLASLTLKQMIFTKEKDQIQETLCFETNQFFVRRSLWPVNTKSFLIRDLEKNQP